MTDILFAIVSIAIYIVGYVEKRSMQTTIDQLTSKLMAKDLQEYVRLSYAPEKLEARKRSTMSWHDDNDIEVEEGE